MEKINILASRLLKDKEVNMVIGFGEGSQGRVRPLFASNEADAEKLIYDKRCTYNLAVYVTKKETTNGVGKRAVVASVSVLRSIIRLAAEKQIKEGDLIALCVNDGGEATVCSTFDEMEKYLASAAPQIRPQDAELIERLKKMNPTERWAFWKAEMENCIKCYACRQTCPLCYCTQCTVEVNQPQWIPVAASTLGNVEWHVMRAMHLSGRCIACGQCGDACPVGIPIHLLPIKSTQDVTNSYGTTSGMAHDEGNAMSTYKPDDKENFIG